MIDGYSKKRGFTLVEALVVVAIMGILSGIGVAGLQSAVANSRIKDAGINVTAFMERAANEATRLNEKLCVKVENSSKSLRVYKGGCSESLGDKVDEMNLESSNNFIINGSCRVGNGTIQPYAGSLVTLTPKIGVSPIPSGCFLVQYGNSDRRAAIIKTTTKFAMFYQLSYDNGSSWTNP